MKRINAMRWAMLGLSLWAGAAATLGQSGSTAVGVLQRPGDVGTLLDRDPLSTTPPLKTYTVGGSGDNMRAKRSDFPFYYQRKVTAKNSKNLSLAADICLFLARGETNHRKAMLIVRQNKMSIQRCGCRALHGKRANVIAIAGNTGEQDHEIEWSISAQKGLKLENYGDRFYLWTHGGDRQWHFAGSRPRWNWSCICGYVSELRPQ